MPEASVTVNKSMKSGKYTLVQEPIDPELEEYKTMFTFYSLEANRKLCKIGRKSGFTISVLETLILKLRIGYAHVNITQTELAKELEVSQQTLTDALTTLTNEELIIKVKNGLYIVNPKYIWRCTELERAKMLKTIKNDPINGYKQISNIE